LIMDKTFSGSGCYINGQQGRTLLESLLVLIMVAFFLLIAVEKFWTSAYMAREAALNIELANIRRAVNLYIITKGKLPESLKQLVKEQIVIPKHDVLVRMEWPYIQNMSLDNEGYPLDPFGNRFVYDAKSGKVKSGTKGYEMW